MPTEQEPSLANVLAKSDFADWETARRRAYVRDNLSSGRDPSMPFGEYAGGLLQDFAIQATPGLSSGLSAVSAYREGRPWAAAGNAAMALLDGLTIGAMLGKGRAVEQLPSSLRTQFPNADVSLGRPMEAPMRAYRGSVSNKQRFREGTRVFASDDPAIASTYASSGAAYASSGAAPNVMPLDIQFQNPLIYNLKSPTPYNRIIPPPEFSPLKGGVFSTDDLANHARNRGHDGVIFKNLRDDVYGGGSPSTIFIALGKNTMRSPLTGETVYGLAPFGLGLGVYELGQLGEQQSPEAYANLLASVLADEMDK